MEDAVSFSPHSRSFWIGARVDAGAGEGVGVAPHKRDGTAGQCTHHGVATPIFFEEK